MFATPKEPLNAPSLIKTAWALYKQVLQKSWYLSLLSALFLFAPQLLLHSFYRQPSLQVEQIPMSFYSYAILFWAIGVILQAALIYQIYALCKGFSSTIIGSIRHATAKLIPLVIVGLLYVIVVLAGTMMFILPGIILAVNLSLAFIIIITETEWFLHSLIKSNSLVWGNWWHTLRVLSFPILLNLGISLSLVFFILKGMLLNLLPENIGQYLIYCANCITQATMLPFLFAVAIVLLNDLRLRSNKP